MPSAPTSKMFRAKRARDRLGQQGRSQGIDQVEEAHAPAAVEGIQHAVHDLEVCCRQAQPSEVPQIHHQVEVGEIDDVDPVVIGGHVGQRTIHRQIRGPATRQWDPVAQVDLDGLAAIQDGQPPEEVVAGDQEVVPDPDRRGYVIGHVAERPDVRAGIVQVVDLDVMPIEHEREPVVAEARVGDVPVERRVERVQLRGAGVLQIDEQGLGQRRVEHDRPAAITDDVPVPGYGQAQDHGVGRGVDHQQPAVGVDGRHQSRPAGRPRWRRWSRPAGRGGPAPRRRRGR